jgi:hypothetical protein
MNLYSYFQLNQETERFSLKVILLLGGIALVTNLGLCLTNYYDWNFDSWAHMFFASHYTNSWFDTWEPRWYGGFSVTSYPPLVTQLIAGLGYIFGLEYAYVIVSLIAMALVPIAVYLFCLNFLSHKNATWAGLLAVFLPSIYITNYMWGQLPFLLATISTLFMGYFLGRFLEEGRFVKGLIAALLMGITAASHHMAFICFVPVIAIVTVLTHLILAKRNFKTISLRTLVFASLSLPFVVFPVFLFWRFLLTSSVQTEIFHITRTNLFSDGLVFLQWVVAPYFLLILILPLIPLAAVKHRHLIPLVILVVVFFILGLGGSTPLPRLIFGDWWKWLTYERFTLWASVLLIPLAVSLVKDLPALKKVSETLQKILLAGIILAMCVASLYFGSEPLRKTFSPSPPAVNVEVLSELLESSNWDGAETITFTATNPDLLSDYDSATFTVKSLNVNEGLLRVQTVPAIPTKILLDDIPQGDWGVDWIKIQPGTYSLSFSDVYNYQMPNTITLNYYPGPKGIIQSLNDPLNIYEDTVTEVTTSFIELENTGGEIPSEGATINLHLQETLKDALNVEENVKEDSPVVMDIPDQTIAENESFTPINLDDYISNGNTADNDITWTYSGNVELNVNIEDNIATITPPDSEIGIEYYYLTLGFGEAQFQKLSTLTNARSLDGTYYTARTLPILTESGIASIDSIKYFDPELKTLRAILKDAPSYHLKWVLVNDVFYYDVLKEYGFRLRWSAEKLFDYRLAGVTIWERSDATPIVDENKSETGFWSYVWGIAPLSLVALLFTILVIEFRSSTLRKNNLK